MNKTLRTAAFPALLLVLAVTYTCAILVRFFG
jgi:hypothetical protein